MPIPKSTELRIKCRTCKDFTEGQEPVTIKKYGKNKFNIKIVCSICKGLKSKTLNERQRRILPKEILEMPENTEVVNNITKDGGILPIIPLIAAVISGIGALGSIGGATANAIISSKKANEDERHNREMETITKNAVSGNGMSEQEALKVLTGKGYLIV
jgi:hypothetical protein